MSETLQQPQQKKGVLRISLIALVIGLYIAHKVMPIVGYYTPAIVRAGMCGLLFLLLIPQFQRKATWALFGMFAISLLDLVNRAVNGQELALYIYGEIQVLVYGLIAFRFAAKDDKRTCRNMFFAVLVMYLFTAVTTIIGNGNYPNASRNLATLSATTFAHSVYTKNNIGNFSFAYELVLFTPLIIYMTRQKLVKPLLGYGMLVLIGYCLMVMEYGMAAIMFFINLMLLVLPKLTTKRLLVILMVILLVFLLFSGWFADVFEFASEATNSRTLSDRFLSVAETLRGEQETSSESTETRNKHYMTSLNSFLDTSFLGGWGRKDIGAHSFVLDTLGNYGLLGLAGLVVMFMTIYKLCLKPFRKYDFYPYFLWTCLIAVFMMVMNPKAYEFIFLCVLPLFGYWQMPERLPEMTANDTKTI